MVPLVDLRHLLVAEEDIEHALDERRPQGDRVAAKGLADPEGSAAVTKLPALGDRTRSAGPYSMGGRTSGKARGLTRYRLAGTASPRGE